MNNDKEKNNKKDKEGLTKEQNPSENIEDTPCEAPEEAKGKKEDYNTLWDKYVRLCAEFVNARKRWDRDREDLIKFSTSSLLKDLLIILDETEQALKMTKEHSNIEEIIKGLEMTYNNFVSVLKKQGLTPMDTIGKDFNPHLHEIIASKEVEDNIDKPVVLEEIQKGYMLQDKVLRPAKVVVGVKKEIIDNSVKSIEDQKPETKDKDNR